MYFVVVCEIIGRYSLHCHWGCVRWTKFMKRAKEVNRRLGKMITRKMLANSDNNCSPIDRIRGTMMLKVASKWSAGCWSYYTFQNKKNVGIYVHQLEWNRNSRFIGTTPRKNKKLWTMGFVSFVYLQIYPCLPTYLPPSLQPNLEPSKAWQMNMNISLILRQKEKKNVNSIMQLLFFLYFLSDRLLRFCYFDAIFHLICNINSIFINLLNLNNFNEI